VKFSTNVTAGINIGGTLSCLTGPYRLAVFTAKDDNTVGEIISGSTGVPIGYYGGEPTISGTHAFSHIRFSYLRDPLYFESGIAEVNNAQFVKCYRGFIAGGMEIHLNNILASEVTYFIGGWSSQVHGSHWTLHNCNSDSFDDGSVFLTNSLLVESSYDATDLVTNSVVVLGSSTGVFQTVGAGAHYLAENSPYRNAGTTNIGSALAADLKKKTTYPPIVFSNQTVLAEMVLFPQAQRDTDIPDLGYHYDPLDYAFGFLRLTNGTTRVLPGTAIGTFSGGNTYGMALLTGSKLISEGTPTAPNHIARYNTVQEQANLNWTNSSWSVVGNWWGGAVAELNCRFTKWEAMGSAGNHFGEFYNAMPMRLVDCEFYGSGFATLASSPCITNCLFDRVQTSFSDEMGSSTVTLRNCLFRGGRLSLEHWDSGDWIFRDNLFDNVVLYQDGDVDADYNGYVTGSTRITPNGTDDVLDSLTHETGPLGLYYQPTDSDFIDVGSQSAVAAGLYHYTVTADQTKETSTVDIGYHYVALDENGNPMDSDGDGVPDYKEDGNGNGSVDSGETDWQVATDLGLKVLITEPKRSSDLP
jgi:hypothetical protein